MSGSSVLRVVCPLTDETLPAKKQRMADGAKILLDIAKESSDWFGPLKSALGGVSALIKHYEVFVQSMAVACVLRERSQEFKDVEEKVEALTPHLRRFRRNADVAACDGDQEEENRRFELFRYAHRFLTTPTPVIPLPSAMERIEKRSHELLQKSTAARFLDKRSDSAEVAGLVDQLKEAITHYQVRNTRFVGLSAAYTIG